MSRPIKFRAWDKEENRYWYLDEQGTEKGEAFSRWIKYPERYVIEQFTGLLDKNGKEIYEGDIVTAHPDYYRVSDIYFDDFYASFRFRADEDDEPLEITEYFAKQLEVIGNIYSNPELLEARNV